MKIKKFTKENVNVEVLNVKAIENSIYGSDVELTVKFTDKETGLVICDEYLFNVSGAYIDEYEDFCYRAEEDEDYVFYGREWDSLTDEEMKMVEEEALDILNVCEEEFWYYEADEENGSFDELFEQYEKEHNTMFYILEDNEIIIEDACVTAENIYDVFVESDYFISVYNINMERDIYKYTKNGKYYFSYDGKNIIEFEIDKSKKSVVLTEDLLYDKYWECDEYPGTTIYYYNEIA